MFSSEKFALVRLAGVQEVESFSLLPTGHSSKRAKPAAPKREEGRGEERELGPRGIQVETWERNGLGGIQDSGLGTRQEFESDFVLLGCHRQWKQLRLIGHLGSHPALHCL